MSLEYFVFVKLFMESFQIARSFVISKVKDYPQFQAVAIAVQKSGFKVGFFPCECI